MGLIGQLAHELNEEEDQNRSQYLITSLCLAIGALRDKEITKLLENNKDINVRQALYDTVTQAVIIISSKTV